jgi:hypothetical protein
MGDITIGYLVKGTAGNFSNRKFPIAYTEQIGNNATRSESLVMLVLDPLMVTALAAVITSFSALVWAIRRRP